MNHPPLPKFDNPPVVETVMGVEFSRIEGWELPHFGLYWNTIRDQFPQASQKPLLLSQTAEPLSLPMVRCWFAEPGERDLIQLQDNRFIFNWRKGEGHHSYPRYVDYVRPAFETRWAGFREFLKSQGLACPSPLRGEITYVNHILRGEGWEDFCDWSRVFAFLSQSRVGTFLPLPTTGECRLSFDLPNHAGRLTAAVEHGVRKQDSRELLIFRLSVMGKFSGQGDDGLLRWFDLGREWIVRGFTELTTTEMHQLWGRTE